QPGHGADVAGAICARRRITNFEHAASPSSRTVDAAATSRISRAGDYEGTTMKVAAVAAASTARSAGKRRAAYQSWCAQGRWEGWSRGPLPRRPTQPTNQIPPH